MGSGMGLNFLEFSSKNVGFYAFLLRKTTCAQKPGRDRAGGGLIDHPGSKDVKCTWG